jgi:uncharacterized protein (UPF0276 family)
VRQFEDDSSLSLNGLPLNAGVGLKPEHFSEAGLHSPEEIWFEVHPENYMIGGGPRLRGLQSIREQYSLSLHGVGASLGGPELCDAKHITAIRQLIDRFEPESVSEHAVWSRANGVYYADLLPLPRTLLAMQQLVDGVNHFQEGIGRQILLENPSNYLPVVSEMDEADFLVSVAEQTGCGLLIDVNNIYVSSQNCGIDAAAYIHAIPAERVGEIHVAGFDLDPKLGKRLLIDSHAADVAPEVWELLDLALTHFGPKPVLLERDDNLPAYSELLAERTLAEQAIKRAKSLLHNALNNEDKRYA